MATSLNYADQMNINTLTVDKQWKVEVEIADKLSRQSGPSKLVPVAKWFFTILLGSLITCIFVATKLSFISLARFLKDVMPKSKDFNHNEWVHYTGHFLLIYLTLAVPYFLLFLRATWCGLSSKTVAWPSRTAICLCVLVGILEPFGLVLLALKVLPNMSPAVGAFTMSSFILFSVIGETVESFRHNSRHLRKFLNVVSIILLLGGVGLTLYMAVEPNTADEKIWHLPVCIMVLNFSWLPWIQKRLTETNSPTVEETVAGTSDGTDHTTATWKSSLIIYGVKNISTFLFCFIFFYLDTDWPINFTSDMQSAFLSAWDFESSITNCQVWVDFGVNLAGGLVGYVLVAVACHTNMQRGCLAVPLVLSLPVSVIVIKVYELCKIVVDDTKYSFCSADNNSRVLIGLVTLVYCLGHLLSIGRKSFKKELVYLQKERELFWIPGYNGAVLDFFLLLNRKQTSHMTVLTNRDLPISKKTRVYICTTMYREDEGEMKQLLESLSKVNVAQQEGETFFQSHIFFDGGVNNNKLSQFPLVLISLLEETLGVKPEHCTKVATPYGLKLSWGLPSQRNKERMTFNIHLKDNKLVKNKKRWSQVMYMSYVLDFLKVSAYPSVESYILTTDADVMFTPDSVEALIDLMTRDSSIGAVCARTHPMGSGPLVWYQVFEYAVGHWFQKASEHVLGSVLCAPGCFSVYRCRALSDVLPKYCKKVESAFDFLTKDMGEDRWLCTLMLQSGWRIEYCAASENSTNCPAEFEEFYKQRRRWIASTLANLMLIIKEWKYIALFNHRLTVVFLTYQALLLFSTLIAPSMVILVVSGGLEYAWDINVTSVVIIQVFFCIMYTLVCLYTSQDTQMLVSKLYTFFYAVVMCAVAVGTAEQVVMDFADDSMSDQSPNRTKNLLFETTTKKPSQHISINLPVSVTTIYLAFLVGVFILGGILHPREFTCLLHGIWYLLCLPSAYLVLILYSICNLTDSSWGTREEIKATVGFKTHWWSEVYTKLKKIFFCCEGKKKTSGISIGVQTQMSLFTPTSRASSMYDEGAMFSGHQGFLDGHFHSEEYLSSIDDIDSNARVSNVENQVLEIDQWLPQELNAIYCDIFKKHGYENTLFIKGLTESDLLQMGVQRKGHVQFILGQISNLPTFEIEYKVPSDVDDWLNEIGLLMYKDKFHKNKIKTLKEMEILKSFNEKTIADQLEIKKQGHIKRLLYAIRMLRDPTDAQKKASRIRQLLDDVDLQELRMCNIGEFEFWSNLKLKCLEPDLKAFGMDADIKEKLVGLRNNWLMTIAIANTLWLILLSTIATKGNLTVIGANPMGLVFLFIFGLLFLIQFLAMIIHRLSTLCHYIARAPYTFGNPLLTNWSFHDKFINHILVTCDNVEDIDDHLPRSESNIMPNERTPLL